MKAYAPCSPQIESMFLEMLQASNTCWEIVPHLSGSFQCLSQPVKTEVLKEVKTMLLGTKQWRKVSDVLRHVPDMAKCWKVSDAIEHIQPAVLKLMQDACWHVRCQCVEIVAVMIHGNYYKGKRLALCNTMITQFAQSNKHRNRLLFVSFCGEIMQTSSKSTFETLFFPLLLSLAGDPNSSVRIHLAATLTSVGRYFTGEEGWSRSIADAMKRLSEDTDREVVLSAQTALRVMSDHRYWESSRTVEIEDAERVKYESQLDQLEFTVHPTQEQEEAKKAFMQELTRKARLEYQEQYKASSRRSTSRSKPSSNRNTPTRVKKRSSMSQEKVTNGAPIPPTVRPFIAKLPVGRSDGPKPGKKK